MKFDGTDEGKLVAHAVIEWASCEIHGTHVKATVALRRLSQKEMAAMVQRVADRVPGMRRFAVQRSTIGTTLTIRPTKGNATVQGTEWILEQLAAALNLELTKEARKNDKLIVQNMLELFAEYFGRLSPNDSPHGQRRGFSSWDI